MLLPQFYIDDVIKTAVMEDINYLDQASAFVIPADSVTTARFVAKAAGVLCGIEVALRVFALLDPETKAEVYKQDGDAVEKGDVIGRITGRTQALLQG